MSTCPECGEQVPVRTPPVLYCPACGAPQPGAPDPGTGDADGPTGTGDDNGSGDEAGDAAGAASVRPPDLTVVGGGPDPLEDWDTTPEAVAVDPPPAWVLLAGTAVVAGLVGMVASRRRMRGGLLGAGLGAVAAAAGLRVWELEPEDTFWARALSEDA